MEEWRRWLASQIDELDLAILRGHLLADQSDDPRNFADFLAGYACELQRTFAPANGADDVFGLYDYVAILHLRGTLERELAAACEDVRRVAAEVVVGLDNQLIVATEHDPTSRIRQLEGADARDYWWWDRIPKGGLPRRELDDWFPSD